MLKESKFRVLTNDNRYLNQMIHLESHNMKVSQEFVKTQFSNPTVEWASVLLQGQVVGFVRFQFPQDNNSIYIESLQIAQPFRGGKLFQILASVILKNSFDKDIEIDVNLPSQSLYKMYQKMNFKERKRNQRQARLILKKEHVSKIESWLKQR